MATFRSNFSGRRAPGYRFRFHVQAIAHRALYLPRPMRDLPEIARLLAGVDPCEVFGAFDIHEARKSFNRLRIRYDFPYWAATRFPISHIDDPDVVTTLVLNEDQHHIIDKFLKTYQDKQLGRFVITKKGPPCGVSTCVQAHIIWLQLFHNPKNAQICGPSNRQNSKLKDNIGAFFGKERVSYSRNRFQICGWDTSAIFNTFNRPDSLRGIDFGYVHLFDMAKWRDLDGIRTSRAVKAAKSGILLDYRTLIVLEGDQPSPKYNPVFHRQVLSAASPIPNPLFQHINLSDFT